ncbi:condensin-2 complex subunit D3 [Tanacetum coccineum]
MWRLKCEFTFIIGILVLVSSSCKVNGMRFDIKTGATKCITDDIQSYSLSVGKFTIVNPDQDYPLPDSHRITVRISSPLGNNCHYADQKEFGTFAFTANEDGDYMACFMVAKQNPPATLTVEFDWRSGLAAKDWSKVAKRGQLEMMEIDLKKLFDTVASIHDEMFCLRERGVIFLRFLLLLVDESEKIRELADFLFAKSPLLAYNSFVEAIYVLNDCNAHTGQSNFGDSQKENRLFCIQGNDEKSKSQRMHIYVSLLKQMAPEQLLATFSKVSSEILVAPCEEMKIPTNKGSSLESSEMEEESAENAVKGRVTQAVKKAQIQNTIPMFIELKRLLESKNSPLTGSLMECLRILLKDYKSETDEMLVADKQLQKELTYDMKKYETLKAKSTAAEAVSKGKGVSENHLNTSSKVSSAMAGARAEVTAKSVLRDVNEGAATPTLSSMNVIEVYEHCWKLRDLRCHEIEVQGSKIARIERCLQLAIYILLLSPHSFTQSWKGVSVDKMVETEDINLKTGKPKKNKGQSSSEELKLSDFDHFSILSLVQFSMEIFLMGLNDVFGNVRSSILITEPLPDVKSAFATLSRDESHMANNVHSSNKSISTSFVSRNNNDLTANRSNNQNSQNRRFNRGPNPNLVVRTVT